MRTTRLLIGLALAISSPPGLAQQVIPLWGEDRPLYSKTHSIEEYEDQCWKVTCAYQVVNPTLTLYRPRGTANGNAVIILPGGGYETLAVYHEGYEIAEALARRGNTAVVLKYRLPNPETSTHPERVPLSDLRQALQSLRENQVELGFSAMRFGVLGFSAGSHLATFASVNRSPDPAQNPDFSILVYGVTRLTPENHQWLEESLYFRPLTASEISEETLLERVDQNTPPAFLVHSLDDTVCHYTESTLYAEALKQHGVEAELHLFPHGGHGFGPGREEDSTRQWLDLAANWLDRLNTLTTD